MPKHMLVNVTHPEESRVGILNDGVLEAFEIESLSREHLKGNIYTGVVRRIHPALEAAFVDIGAGRDAFLPLDEVCFRNLPRPPAEDRSEGNGRRRMRLRDVLKSGDKVVVQIAKEPFGNKPPTLTTFYSLPGRHLVLLPGSADAGISRRIEGEERVRMRKLIEELKPPEGFGLIVRTAAAADENGAEFERDLAYLLRLWENVSRAAEASRGPGLIYREHDIVLRTIRDFFTPDIDEIHIDNEDVYKRAHDFLENVLPGNEKTLRLYRGAQPIFSAFDVEAQFESIFKRRVSLSSGGSIVIDSTEALTAIDVNSGGSVRGANPEETAFRTNEQAAAEIARQLRLRDIGGLIVIDFIDMRDPKHIHEVEKVIRNAMRLDRARHEIGRISRFGLMEISRQRLRPAAMATTYASCPMCEGHGAVRTVESAALVTFRKIHNRISLGDVDSMRVCVPSRVGLYLLNQKREDLARLEERYGSPVEVRLDDQLMPHEVKIDIVERKRSPEPAAEVAPGSVAETAAEGPTPEAAPAGAGKKGRKRRRRRGRGGLRAALAIAEAVSGIRYQVENGEVRIVRASDEEAAEEAGEGEAPREAASPEAAEEESRPRRRRRRSGRLRPVPPAEAPLAAPGEEALPGADGEAAPSGDREAKEEAPAAAAAEEGSRPKRRRSRRRPKRAAAEAAASAPSAPEIPEAPAPASAVEVSPEAEPSPAAAAAVAAAVVEEAAPVAEGPAADSPAEAQPEPSLPSATAGEGTAVTGAEMAETAPAAEEKKRGRSTAPRRSTRKAASTTRRKAAAGEKKPAAGDMAKQTRRASTRKTAGENGSAAASRTRKTTTRKTASSASAPADAQATAAPEKKTETKSKSKRAGSSSRATKSTAATKTAARKKASSGTTRTRSTSRARATSASTRRKKKDDTPAGEGGSEQAG